MRINKGSNSMRSQRTLQDSCSEQEALKKTIDAELGESHEHNCDRMKALADALRKEVQTLIPNIQNNLAQVQGFGTPMKLLKLQVTRDLVDKLDNVEAAWRVLDKTLERQRSLRKTLLEDALSTKSEKARKKFLIVAMWKQANLNSRLEQLNKLVDEIRKADKEISQGLAGLISAAKADVSSTH